MLAKSKLAAAIMLCSLSGVTQADFARVGPINADHGYPDWYQNESGLALDICLPNASELDSGACLILPGDLTLPEVFPTNFPDEHFYWAASNITPVNGGVAAFEMAMEAAFAGFEVQDGDQVVFTRIRMRIDIPEPGGTYTITHPFGVEIFPNLSPGTKVINFTDDFGISVGDFTTVLKSRVSPFLQASASAGGAPSPFYIDPIGGNTLLVDPAVETFVTGSPFDTNFFRIEGPNIGGEGINVVENSKFSMIGKVHTATISLELSLDSATYRRDATSSLIEIHADATPSIGEPVPVLAVSGDNIKSFVMHTDGSGHYHIQIKPETSHLVPASINITDYAPANPTVTQFNLVDKLSISSATWDATTQTLVVNAQSSDQSALSPPSLRVFIGGQFIGEIVNGTLTATGISIPASSVEVISSAGGKTSVKITNGLMQPIRPVAVNDAASTINDAPVFIDLTANDDASIVTSTVTIIGPPQNGVAILDGLGGITYTRNVNFEGTDNIYYVAKDSDGNRSNLATVSILVTPELTPPTAFDDAASVAISTSIRIDILANDSDPENNIDIKTVAVIQPATGSVVVNIDGSVTYTAASFENVDTFTYTVSDSLSLVSNSATVTVNVLSATTNNPPVAGDNAFTVYGNTTSTFDVLFNDSDPEGGQLGTVTIVTPPLEGVATVNTDDGTIIFTSGSTASTQTFTYTVQDVDGLSSNEATVTVTVNAPDVISLAKAQVKGNNWRVEGTSSIIGGQIITIYIGIDFTGPILGYATVDPTGTWKYRKQNIILLDSSESISIKSAFGGTLIGESVSIK